MSNDWQVQRAWWKRRFGLGFSEDCSHQNHGRKKSIAQPCKSALFDLSENSLDEISFYLRKVGLLRDMRKTSYIASVTNNYHRLTYTREYSPKAIICINFINKSNSYINKDKNHLQCSMFSFIMSCIKNHTITKAE